MNDILALTAAAAFVSLCGVAVSAGRLVRRVRSERQLSEETAARTATERSNLTGTQLPTTRLLDQELEEFAHATELDSGIREVQSEWELLERRFQLSREAAESWREQLAARQELIAKELGEALEPLVRRLAERQELIAKDLGEVLEPLVRQLAARRESAKEVEDALERFVRRLAERQELMAKELKEAPERSMRQREE